MRQQINRKAVGGEAIVEIIYAMQLLNINKLEVGAEKTVKKAWREAMKNNHPDIGGSQEAAVQFNEAYRILISKLGELKEIKEEQKRNRVRTFIVDLKNMGNFYSGSAVEAHELTDGETAQTTIVKSDIHKHNLYIAIRAEISYSGHTDTITNRVLYSLTNKYSIRSLVRCKSISEAIEVKIQIGDMSKTINLMSHKATVAFKLESGIDVSVHIERKIDCG